MTKQSLLSRLLARGAGSGESQKPGGERITSNLIGELLRGRGPDEHSRLVVLDLGPATQSTVEFFGRHGGRIHFVDLYSCELLHAPPAEGLDTAAAAAEFSRHLDLPEDARFDVCLLWDALMYLELDLVRGLSRALAPHLHDGTRGYGFGALHSRTFPACRYAIGDEGHLEVRPLAADDRPAPPHGHTQQQLLEYFPCLSIQRATLLQSGLLELLFGRD